MFCKYCGSNIDDDSVFCNKCGGKQTKSEGEVAPQPVNLANSEPVVATGAVATDTQKKPLNKRLIAIIIIAVLLVSTAVTVVLIVLNMPNTKITLENYNKIIEHETTYNEVCELFGEQGKPFSSTSADGFAIYTWTYTHNGHTRVVAISFENNIVTHKAQTGLLE